MHGVATESQPQQQSPRPESVADEPPTLVQVRLTPSADRSGRPVVSISLSEAVVMRAAAKAKSEAVTGELSHVTSSFVQASPVAQSPRALSPRSQRVLDGILVEECIQTEDASLSPIAHHSPVHHDIGVGEDPAFPFVGIPPTMRVQLSPMNSPRSRIPVLVRSPPARPSPAQEFPNVDEDDVASHIREHTSGASPDHAGPQAPSPGKPLLSPHAWLRAVNAEEGVKSARSARDRDRARAMTEQYAKQKAYGSYGMSTGVADCWDQCTAGADRGRSTAPEGD